MFEPKIAITIVVAFILMIWFLSSNSTVTGFFGYMGDRLGSISPGAVRDIDLSVATDKYGDIHFVARDPINFTVVGYTTATLKTGNLMTDKSLSIHGFTGRGSIINNTLLLDGPKRIDRISW
jgi:hypothetical protein